MIDWNSDPELRALRDEFVASFVERTRLLEAVMSRLRPLGSSPVALGEGLADGLHVIAHNLAGAAPTYGFERLGEIASRIDDLLSGEARSLPAAQLLEEASRLKMELTSCVGSPACGAKS